MWGGGGGDAPGDCAMASTQVSIGMLGASPFLPRAEALVRWQADWDMSGTNKLVGSRLCNSNIVFRGVGGGLVPFTVVS